MLAAGRDVAVMAELDAGLSRVREAYLRQALDGTVPDAAFWKPREDAVVAELARRFYNRDVQKAVKPDEVAPPVGMSGFDRHEQQLTEHAIRMTHERLKQIPFVGQKEYRDD